MFKVLVLQPNKAQSPVLVLGAFFTREEVFDYSTKHSQQVHENNWALTYKLLCM